jgi:hypothetical protein
VADLLSRSDQILPTEWSLNQRVFRVLCTLWGSPQIDLFATRYNAKLITFMSPMPDPLAYEVDALSHSWDGMWAYAYPPPAILSQVLGKVQVDNVKLLLIAPNWPAQRWFPQLLTYLIDLPRSLPLWPDLLSQAHNGALHRRLDQLQLHAWLLSAESSSRQAFRQTLPRGSLPPNGGPRSLSTSQNGEDLLIGVSNGRLIHSRPLLL